MWKSGAFRMRRHDVLTEMVRLARRAGSYAEPWDRTPGIWQNYSNEGEVLADLHHQWRTELASAIFIAIDHGNGDLCADVGAAYAAVMAKLPGVREILDLYADHPAIAASLHKERALLSAAGQAMRDAA